VGFAFLKLSIRGGVDKHELLCISSSRNASCDFDFDHCTRVICIFVSPSRSLCQKFFIYYSHNLIF
jgi:hypothetical protein